MVADGKLTQRGADRVIRLAWTVADLGGREQPTISDVWEALFLRTKGVQGRTMRSERMAS
jgi:magnesium chelatase family protein